MIGWRGGKRLFLRDADGAKEEKSAGNGSTPGGDSFRLGLEGEEEEEKSCRTFLLS